MKRILVALLATIGVLALFVVAGVATAFWTLAPGRPTPLPARVVVALDLRGGLEEAATPGPLAWFDGPPPLTLERAVATLDAAAVDPRVGGLIARLDGEARGFAQVQELRDAVARFRAAGKPTLAYADSFGELSPGTSGYYLASGFDRVTLQPHGLVGLTGVWAEVPLLGGFLDSIGVAFRLESREAYKTFRDTFVERELTPENRESLESLTGDMHAQLVADVARSRGLAPEAVRATIDRGPLLAREALDARLIDRLGYLDEAGAEALAAAGPGAVPVPAEDYAALRLPEFEPAAGPAIALVEAAGPILQGSGGGGGLGPTTVGADDLVAALDQAREDGEVRAVVLRVDSPGGSAVASETIGRAVRRLRAAGKPVIASMGDAAASGGYWIVMDADAIVARPGTITGSIGVVGGKPVVRGLLDRLRINVPGVGVGANADFWSSTRDYDPAGEARLNAFLDDAYRAFVNGVARGRKLDRAAVERVAGGRVWTGRQAMDRGLVDGLGGLRAALDRAKAAAGLPADRPARLLRLPEPPDPLTALLSLGNIGARIEAGLRPFTTALPALASPLALR